MSADMAIAIKFTASAGAALGALKGVSGAFEQLRKVTSVLTKEQTRLQQVLSSAAPLSSASFAALNKQYERLGRTIEKLQLKQLRLNNLISRRGELKGQRDELKGQILSTAALGATAFFPVKLAIDFESSMADVRKVVDFKAPDGFKKLSDDILALTRSLPMSVNELAQIAAAGGQLGVAEEDITSFTTQIAKMAVAFDMSAEDAGDSMAKLANVYKIPITEIGKLGDAINELSNKSPAKASDIVNALGRVGGVAKQFGLTEFAAASLSNTMISLGKRPEVAGTAINSMLVKLMTAEQQGAKFENVLKAMGTSSVQLKRDIKNNAEGALVSFLEQINKLPKDDQMGALVNLFGREFADDIAVLAGNTDLYRESISHLQTLGKDGKLSFLGSMEKEFQARAATTANSWQLLKNGLTELGITVGSVVLPEINELLSSIKPVVNSMATWAKNNPELTRTLTKIVVSLAAFKIGFLAARFGMNFFNTAVNEARIVLTVFQSRWLATTAAVQAGSAPLAGAVTWFKKLGLAVASFSRTLFLTPVGWLALAIAGAAFLIYKYWKPISAFFKGLWQGIKAGLAPLMPAFDSLCTAISPLLGFLKHLFSAEQEAAGGAMDAGYAIGRILADAIKGLMAVIWLLVQAFTVAGEFIGRTIGEIVVAFDGGIAGISALILNWSPLGLFYSAFASVLSWFGIDLPAKFTGFGSMIIDGLINGLKAKFAELEVWWAEKSAWIGKVFAFTNKIQSPSRLFMQHGGHIVEGLAIGLAKTAPKAESEIKSLSDRLGLDPKNQLDGSVGLGGMFGMAPNAQGAANVTIHFAPVINGGGDPVQIGKQLSLSYQEFEALMKQYDFNKTRRSF